MTNTPTERLTELLAKADLRLPLTTGYRTQTSDYGDKVLCVLDARSLTLASADDDEQAIYAPLFAEAVNALPTLLAELAQARAEIGRLREDFAEMTDRAEREADESDRLRAEVGRLGGTIKLMRDISRAAYGAFTRRRQ